MSDIKALTYEDAVAITPSDSVTFAKPFAGFYTGSGGTIKVTTAKGTICAFANLPAGVIVPLAILQVWNANTGATGIFGMKSFPYPGVP